MSDRAKGVFAPIPVEEGSFELGHMRGSFGALDLPDPMSPFGPKPSSGPLKSGYIQDGKYIETCC